MADFMHDGWSLYIAVVTLVSIAACLVLAMSLASRKAPRNAAGEVETTGHIWDEDLTELNNPLPRWWLYLFYLTCIFALVYLWLYPGLGSFQGQLKWTQFSQYEAEVEKVDAAIAPLYERYQSMTVAEISKDGDAIAMGERLYQTYCVQCHGSDARGSRGFPNLTDNDWLGKGDTDYIVQTILNGRQAVMPPMAAALGSAKEVDYMANYVLSLSGSGHDGFKAEMGKDSFGTCAACHGTNGKGNPTIGAPNLTDDVWLYGGGLSSIRSAINNGLNNQMPGFSFIVNEDKARLIAAYVWRLSEPARQASQ